MAAAELSSLRIVILTGTAGARSHKQTLFDHNLMRQNAAALRSTEPSPAGKLVSLKLMIEGRSSMGSTTDKIKGATNEAVGKAKQGVGEAVGSDRMQGEGAVQEVKGKGQQALGDAKEATKDAVNKAAAAANKKL
jgi:uncharacterized protein YjbJ (UPF0337 family)